jgi:hypothetical protein
MVEEELAVHVRPVMDWILELTKDRKLTQLFNWYPVRKYIVKDGKETQFLDDVDCREDWWQVQVYIFDVLIIPY